MIRRLNKHSDLKDLIKSCPSGVIDDIYAIEYYIQGYNTVIQENFTKTGDMLEVIIPSTDLETLPNGILMRRAYYKVLDASYPDGYYNLEFEDNMNVWIGENESEEPVIPEYVTEEELEETLEGYVTEETLEETLEGYVTDQEFNGAVGDLTDHINAIDGSLSNYVTDQVFDGFVAQTESRFNDVNVHLQNTDARVAALEQSPGGVSQEQFIAHVEANNESFNILQMVTQDHSQRIDALENAGFATQQDLYAVDNKADAIQDQVDSIDTIVSDLSDSVSDLDTRVTDLEQGGGGGGGTWGSITGDITDQEDLMEVFGEQEGWIHDAEDRIAALEDGTTVPTGTATESWVQQQGYLTSSDLSGYATESWVQQQGYLTQHQDLTGYATETWVQNQGYLTQHQDLTGYATQSWVQQQGYLTSVPSTYATKTWATDQFLEENKVWTGTFTQWVQLTAEQQASYTIALIIE